MGTIEDKLRYLNTTKIKLKDSINLTGANITNDTTFRNYSIKLKESLVNILKGNIWDLFDNFDTVEDSGEEVFLNNSYDETIMKINLKGNTKQDIIEADEGITLSDTLVYANNVNTGREHTIEMSGNTYQETTTGKNLFNKYGDFTYGNTNYKTSLNAQGQIVSTSNFYNNRSAGILINVNQNTDYTISGKIVSADGTGGNNVLIQILNTSGQSIQLEKWASTITKPFDFNFTFNSGGNSQIWVSFNGSNSGTAGNTNTIFDNIQMEQGTTATTYEPFTNGASPNPSYPQNIEVVTGNNTIKIEGKNYAKSCNGIWFNGTAFKYYTQAQGYGFKAEIKPNTTYTISKKNASNRFSVIIGENDVVNNNSFSRILIQEQDTSRTTYTFTSQENEKYVFFGVYRGTNETEIASACENVQIEEGQTATTFEPYVSQTYPINLGNIELCKKGTYQDRIYKQNDKWYLYKEIGKVTLNGTETVTRTATNVTGCYRFNINIGSNIYTTDTTQEDAPFYCNKFVNGSRSKSWILVDCIYPTNSTFNYGSFGIYYDATKEMTPTQFKNWLSQNGIVVYYPYATPTTTEITDTTLVNQLNALYNATIYPITNINTDTSNLLPYIDLHYNFVTPSPSPNRPSNIDVVKGNNVINIHSKNLFDYNNILPAAIGSRTFVTYDNTTKILTLTNYSSDSYFPALYTNAPYAEGINVTVKQNTKYTFSFKADQPGSSLKISVFGLRSDNTYTNLMGGFISDTHFTFDSGQYTQVAFRIGSTSPSETITNFTDFQLEEGETVTEYTPYQIQTYPINLGNMELCKIGTYQDYIYESNGKWFKKNYINKNIIDTSSITRQGTYAHSDYAVITKKQDDIAYNQFWSSNTYVSNVGEYLPNPNWDDDNIGKISGQPQRLYYWLGFIKGTTLEEMKTILSNDNAMIYYVLATPTDTQITDTTLINQLNLIKDNARSYDNQTNITQDNANAPFIITAEAIDKTKI